MKHVGLRFLVSVMLVASATDAFAGASLRTVANGTPEKWGPGAISVVLDGSLDDIDPAAQDAVTSAFGAWMSGTNVNPVVVNRTSDHGVAAQDGVSRILFAPITIAGHEKDVAVTISYADSATGVITEADTIFNSRYDFGVLDASDESDVSRSEKCGKKYDVQNVATHEFGHFFGLGEDMGDTNATMFITSAPCQTHKRELTADDVASIASLYPARTESGGASALTTSSPSSCSVARDKSPARSSSPLFVLAAAAFAFMLRRGSDTRTSRASSRCSRSR